MLKHIDQCMTPQLLKILMEMGHGDEIAVVDGNFPAASHTINCVRQDGNDTVQIIEAILKLMPLDTYVNHTAVLMMHGNEVQRPKIWDAYEQTIIKYENDFKPLYIQREHFYERSKKAYAIVATSDTALYANIILKKGVIRPE